MAAIIPPPRLERTCWNGTAKRKKSRQCAQATSAPVTSRPHRKHFAGSFASPCWLVGDAGANARLLDRICSLLGNSVSKWIVRPRF
jgi:hypothetical protein